MTIKGQNKAPFVEDKGQWSSIIVICSTCSTIPVISHTTTVIHIKNAQCAKKSKYTERSATIKPTFLNLLAHCVMRYHISTDEVHDSYLPGKSEIMSAQFLACPCL